MKFLLLSLRTSTFINRDPLSYDIYVYEIAFMIGVALFMLIRKWMSA